MCEDVMPSGGLTVIGVNHCSDKWCQNDGACMARDVLLLPIPTPMACAKMDVHACRGHAGTGFTDAALSLRPARLDTRPAGGPLLWAGHLVQRQTVCSACNKGKAPVAWHGTVLCLKGPSSPAERTGHAKARRGAGKSGLALKTRSWLRRYPGQRCLMTLAARQWETGGGASHT